MAPPAPSSSPSPSSSVQRNEVVPRSTTTQGRPIRTGSPKRRPLGSLKWIPPLALLRCCCWAALRTADETRRDAAERTSEATMTVVAGNVDWRSRKASQRGNGVSRGCRGHSRRANCSSSPAAHSHSLEGHSSSPESLLQLLRDPATACPRFKPLSTMATPSTPLAGDPAATATATADVDVGLGIDGDKIKDPYYYHLLGVKGNAVRRLAFTPPVRPARCAALAVFLLDSCSRLTLLR